MNEIKRIFEAYTRSEDYAPYNSEAKKIHEIVMDTLAEMLPNKEYEEVEANLNVYNNLIEEDAFKNGFMMAIKIMSASMIG